MIYKCKPNRVTRTYLGGHRIDRIRGIKAEDNYKPEEWIASVVSANPASGQDEGEGLSIVQSGQTLLSVLQENPELLGDYQALPILLKLLDASERLVIQAHPTAEFAQKYLNSPFGKAEGWYIISADEGAHVYLGFQEHATRKDWEKAFEEQDVDKMLSMLHRFDVTEGDVLFVDGGIPHAIGGNCILAELQEPTDLMVVTERVTPSGRKLPEARLHCGLGYEKMFDVFDYTGYSREEIERKYYRHYEVAVNTSCEVMSRELTKKFRLTEYHAEGRLGVSLEGKPAIAVVIEGEGKISDQESETAVKAGDGLFIPAISRDIQLEGSFRILIAAP